MGVLKIYRKLIDYTQKKVGFKIMDLGNRLVLYQKLGILWKYGFIMNLMLDSVQRITKLKIYLIIINI